LLKAVGESC